MFHFLRKYLRRHPKVALLLSSLRTEINYRRNKRLYRDAVLATLVRGYARGVHIENTNVCNAKCGFCGYPKMERKKYITPLDKYKAYVDSCIEYGIRKISFTPIVGDPFVDKYLFERLEYLIEKGVHSTSFITNGIAMTPEKTDRLFLLIPKFRKFKISLSLGGFDSQTYAKAFGVDRFERVRSNLLYFLEERTKIPNPSFGITIQMRFAKQYHQSGILYDELQPYLDQKVQLVDNVQYYGNWGGKVQKSDLDGIGLKAASLPRKFRGACDIMFWGGIVIAADGTVNACACHDTEVTLPIGNLNDNSLEEILKGKRRKQLVGEMMRGDIPQFCQGCTNYRSIYHPKSFFSTQVMKKI